MAPPPQSLPFNKRTVTTLFLAFALIILFYLTVRPPAPPKPNFPVPTSSSSDAAATLSSPPIHDAPVAPEILTGDVISSKIENATAKAELGRAAWKVMHTMMAKFPDKPSKEEQTALVSYIHLFARLYPCGECASHFQKILAKFPPQVSTRSNAAAWACHVHNVVNRSLEKEEFDCSNIGDFYDCGCADDDDKGAKKKEIDAGNEKQSGKIDVTVERNG
ncbi:uncharacterized protein KY384_008976 [Bacidia gigantensis]|uniref:uncharacterized protein n=1 Tax=Bacidia gigantensis TaxID=2732470 RepID=UPI001D039608|nr:uncharacterized protein KY384_008976 [Bacidia gigantensis]KAG8525332.1 hypothetical protein KY384_008976 [Bacidia gigantensis]